MMGTELLNAAHLKDKLKMTVLIVDDSRLIITKMTEMLEEVDSVTALKSCGTYAEAIDLINSFKPVVSLLDINLPDKSGIELLRYVKINSPETTVIMFTNQSTDHYKKLCLKMGANHFLDKSKDFESIPAILTSLS